MCKERIKTRLFAILLVFCMLASSMPLLAYAAEGTEADQAQQVTEEKQGEADTQASQEQTKTAEETVKDVAEKAVSEAAQEPEAAQKTDNTESTEKSSAPRLRAAANDVAEEDDGTGVETDEQTDLPEGGQEVKFVFDGADKLEAWIEGVSESSFSMDPETGDVIVDYDITINNNDTMTLNANSDIIFKGVEGKCLNIGVGNDLDNAKTIVTVSQPGKLATVGTTGECTVYVKVTDTPEDIGETIDGDPDDPNTTVSYSFITAEDDEGKYYGDGDPEVHSSIKKGDKFTGSAVCVSWKYNWGPGPSHADIKCTTGKLKGKVIGTACISGKSKALALKGAKFSYVAKVVKVDSKKGKVTYDVTFYPRDRHNVSYGELSNYHVATQTMAGTTTLSHTPQIDVSVRKVDTQPHYNHPENYNVGGAQFQIYTDEACTKKATDVKGNNALLTITADSTGHSGTSQTITLKKLDGTEFYVKEISCPKGYKLAGIGTVQEDMTVEEPNVIPQVKVVKKAAATDVDYLQFSNNYTLKGAEYTMYCDAACTKVAKDITGKEVVFKTDILGQTSPVRVDMGAYWVKETKASKGFKMDPKTYSFTLTEAHEDEPYEVTSTEEPAYKDPGLKVFKFDPTGAKGWKRLVNAEFTIKYYDVTVPYADENDIDPATVDLSSKTPARQWTFKTRKMPTNDPTVIMAGFDWNSDDPVSGDEFLTEGGSRILPCGFYTIEETESPTGLSLFEKIYHGKVYQPANGAAASIYTEDATADGQIITTAPFFVGILLALLCGYLSLKGKGLIASIPVLITIVLGYIVFIAMGKFDWELVRMMPTFTIPKPFPYGLSMPPVDLVVTMIIVNIFSAVNLYGNVQGYTGILGVEMEKKDEVRYFSVFGLVEGVLASIFGVPSNTSYGENLGFLLLTKVASRVFIIVASIVFIVLSFFGKVGGMMAAMPDAIAGAVLLGVASTLIGIGADNWAHAPKFETREIFIVGFSVFLSFGLNFLPDTFFETVPRLVGTLFKNPVIMVIILVIIMEQIVFRDKKSDAAALSIE